MRKKPVQLPIQSAKFSIFFVIFILILYGFLHIQDNIDNYNNKIVNPRILFCLCFTDGFYFICGMWHHWITW
jgi:hypothetical protein